MRNDHDDQSVLQLVAARISQTPDAVAVEYDDESLTYAELGRRTDLLASRIQSEGAGSDVLVGICVQRSLNMPLGILGILKAGAAYVPLDPNYPPERLGNMVADARLKILLTESEFVERFSNFSIPVLRVDVSGDRSSGERFLNSEPDFNPDRLAYVIYTSGSTGKPKGVAMPYSPLDRLIRWQVAQAVPAGPVVTSQFASMSFDVSFQEIFSTWCTGGKLVVVPDSARQDPRRLARLLIEKQIVRSFLPPVVLQHLAKICDEENCWPTSLREVIAAGEQLRITQPLARFLDYLPACVLQNHYGPTESHVVTAGVVGKVGREWPELPSIGRSIPSASLYLLNDHLKPVPAGDTGELYLGGECLARGYHDQPDLTADRFLPDPFSRDPDATTAAFRDGWFRTGDLVRRDADGYFWFVAREKDIIRRRGENVSGAELDRVIGEHPAVAEAAAIAIASELGEDEILVAVVARAGQALTPQDVAAFCRERLARHKRPRFVVLVDSLPRTPTERVAKFRLRSDPELRARAIEVGYD